MAPSRKRGGASFRRQACRVKSCRAWLGVIYCSCAGTAGVLRQSSSVGQSTRFIPAVSGVQVPPLVPGCNAGIAQLARATAFQAVGRGFEPLFPLHPHSGRHAGTRRPCRFCHDDPLTAIPRNTAVPSVPLLCVADAMPTFSFGSAPSGRQITMRSASRRRPGLDWFTLWVCDVS